MKVLAIDPGTNFGWSCQPCSGHTELSTEPTERMVYFEAAFLDLVRRCQPTVVAFETVHMKSEAQAKIIYGQLGIIRANAFEYEYAVLEVPASQWKKEVLGSGNASKEETQALLMCDNEHAADAVGIEIFVYKKGVTV